MLNAVRRLLGREPAVPAKRLSFSRPLVLLQSDDWGRVGVRDRMAGYRRGRDHRLSRPVIGGAGDPASPS